MRLRYQSTAAPPNSPAMRDYTADHIGYGVHLANERIPLVKRPGSHRKSLMGKRQIAAAVTVGLFLVLAAGLAAALEVPPLKGRVNG